MIIGKNAFFVTPSDSLAVIADNLGLCLGRVFTQTTLLTLQPHPLECIPYFKKHGVQGRQLSRA